ncbi:hypothetical protein LJB71_07400 [Thermomonas sp. S9]|uniref:hypothetical protein n=1 Tax=Thermomonas sp. S9 TaxID=2885203 RepID=UPI00216AD57D|nr:hypothetical protein [Thermomonas sp. S9]MCR6496059.1 hypothetical protein [Thermomonas sp. S9]
MSTRTPHWMALLLAVACLASAINVLLYIRLTDRLTHLQMQLGSQLHRDDADDQDLANEGWTPPSQSRVLARSAPTFAPQTEDRAQVISRLKNVQPPDQAAREMDKLMSQEPSIPGVEQLRVKALQQAIQSMPSDAARPVGLQTTCRGRRCLISAGFADETLASEWANRLLLMGGKNLPPAARIIAVPLGGGSEGVNLQLYLY